MADNYLSRVGMGGVVSTPFAKNREQMLAVEAAKEAELVRRRMAQESQMQAMSPQAPTDNTMSIQRYLSGTRSVDPHIPWVSPAPQEPSSLGYVPGLSVSNFLQLLGFMRPQADPTADRRLGAATGYMALNNQRHLQRLDDFERERIRANMNGIR